MPVEKGSDDDILTSDENIDERENQSFKMVCISLVLLLIVTMIWIGVLFYIFQNNGEPASLHEQSTFSQYASYAIQNIFIVGYTCIFTFFALIFVIVYAVWIRKKAEQIDRKTKNIRQRRKEHIE